VSSEFRSQVEALRPYLLRYASQELRNREAAEDCVQEALLAALAAEARFEARSNLRTWLTGILKHKIVDTIRRQGRERPLEGAEEDLADLDALFNDTGHWVDRPRSRPASPACRRALRRSSCCASTWGSRPPRSARNSP
jgi:RNA polymerase sigma factor (sigma-70 family)